MTPRERIALLLYHYRDVCEGIPGTEPPGDDLLALMCREWNHPGYQRLERLLRVLHERFPRHRQALRARYERYSERVVAKCVVCGQVESAARASRPHLRTHVAGAKLLCRVGSTAPDMRLSVIRDSRGDSRLVSEAIEWLERNWGGEVDVPATLLAYGTHLKVAA